MTIREMEKKKLEKIEKIVNRYFDGFGNIPMEMMGGRARVSMCKIRRVLHYEGDPETARTQEIADGIIEAEIQIIEFDQEGGEAVEG